MATPSKTAAIEEITAEFNDSSAAVLTEYRGLTVAQLKDLRRSLGQETKYAVVKNTLTAIAAKNAGIDAFDEQLSGPTAIAFVKGDAVAAAKSLTEFAKTNDKLVPKVVVVEGQLYPASHVDVLASLPTLDQALSMLARVLSEPAAMFARAVKAVGDKQGGGEEAPAEAEAETA